MVYKAGRQRRQYIEIVVAASTSTKARSCPLIHGPRIGLQASVAGVGSSQKPGWDWGLGDWGLGTGDCAGEFDHWRARQHVKTANPWHRHLVGAFSSTLVHHRPASGSASPVLERSLPLGIGRCEGGAVKWIVESWNCCISRLTLRTTVKAHVDERESQPCQSCQPCQSSCSLQLAVSSSASAAAKPRSRCQSRLQMKRGRCGGALP
jgi:hypothetical protein